MGIAEIRGDVTDTGTGNADELEGSEDNDSIFSLGGDDIIKAAGGDDTVDGGAGADKLTGGPGDDEIRGGTDDDELDGSDGSDRLEGGLGKDKLTGGLGRNTFAGTPGELDSDKVTDFKVGDAVEFSGVSFDRSDLSIRSGSAILDADTDSDGKADSTVTLEGDGIDAERSFVVREVSDDTAVELNEAPTVETPLSNQTATEDKAFNFQFVANTFSDPNGDSLSYSASLADGSDLPNWLSFAPESRTFSGTPTESDDGTLNLQVTATDSEGATASSEFSLNIAEVNDDTETDTVTKPVDVSTFNNNDGQLERMAYDTTPANDKDVTTRLSDDLLNLGTDAEFDNLVGFYEIQDTNGGIETNGDGTVDLLPGDEGYAKAAITNRVTNWELRGGASGDPEKNTTAEQFGDVVVAGGKLYAPFVVANAGEVGFDGFIEAEDAEGEAFNNAATEVDDLVAYFSFLGANPDGARHLEPRGNNTFGFEDLPSNLGVSDNDFNDAVFQFDFSV